MTWGHSAPGSVEITQDDADDLITTVVQSDSTDLNATVVQSNPDNLRANVNLQVGNEDVDNDNPVPVNSVQAVDCSSNDTAAPENDVVATVTYAAAGVGISHLISGVGWSYNDTPNAEQGRIWILDGIETVFDLDITNAGPGFFTFIPPKGGRANRAMEINLAAAGCAGKLSILGHWTE